MTNEIIEKLSMQYGMTETNFHKFMLEQDKKYKETPEEAKSIKDFLDTLK